MARTWKDAVLNRNLFSHLIATRRGLLGRDPDDTEAVDNRTRLLARLAELPYTEDGKDRAHQLERINQELGVTGEDKYRLHARLTTPNRTVVTNNREIVVSNRGTSKLEDLQPDAAILLGLEHANTTFRDARDAFEAEILPYAESSDRDLVLASHSLGGAINSFIFEKYGDQIDSVENFNPGHGLSELFPALPFTHRTAKRNADKVTVHHVVADPISTLTAKSRSLGYKVKIYESEKGSANPHSLSQFAGQLDPDASADPDTPPHKKQRTF